MTIKQHIVISKWMGHKRYLFDHLISVEREFGIDSLVAQMVRSAWCGLEHIHDICSVITISKISVYECYLRNQMIKALNEFDDFPTYCISCICEWLPIHIMLQELIEVTQ